MLASWFDVLISKSITGTIMGAEYPGEYVILDDKGKMHGVISPAHLCELRLGDRVKVRLDRFSGRAEWSSFPIFPEEGGESTDILCLPAIDYEVLARRGHITLAKKTVIADLGKMDAGKDYYINLCGSRCYIRKTSETGAEHNLPKGHVLEIVNSLHPLGREPLLEQICE